MVQRPLTTTLRGRRSDWPLRAASFRLTFNSYPCVNEAVASPPTLRALPQPGANADNQSMGIDFAFDGNGNPTTYKSTATTWDVDDQLTAYGGSLTAGYTSDGLRAWKANSGGTRTYFVYDGDTPVVELTTSGGATTVAAVNTFGPTGLIERELPGAGTETYYQFDHPGAIVRAEKGPKEGTMSFETTLFDGTWEQALQRAHLIPKGKHIRIVEPQPENTDEKEHYRELFAQWIAEAKDLKEIEQADDAETMVASSPDPYGEALEEKFRRMGFKFP